MKIPSRDFFACLGLVLLFGPTVWAQAPATAKVLLKNGKTVSIAPPIKGSVDLRIGGCTALVGINQVRSIKPNATGFDIELKEGMKLSAKIDGQKSITGTGEWGAMSVATADIRSWEGSASPEPALPIEQEDNDPPRSWKLTTRDGTIFDIQNLTFAQEFYGEQGSISDGEFEVSLQLAKVSRLERVEKGWRVVPVKGEAFLFDAFLIKSMKAATAWSYQLAIPTDVIEKIEATSPPSKDPDEDRPVEDRTPPSRFEVTLTDGRTRTFEINNKQLYGNGSLTWHVGHANLQIDWERLESVERQGNGQYQVALRNGPAFACALAKDSFHLEGWSSLGRITAPAAEIRTIKALSRPEPGAAKPAKPAVMHLDTVDHLALDATEFTVSANLDQYLSVQAINWNKVKEVAIRDGKLLLYDALMQEFALTGSVSGTFDGGHFDLPFTALASIKFPAARTEPKPPAKPRVAVTLDDRRKFNIQDATFHNGQIDTNTSWLAAHLEAECEGLKVWFPATRLKTAGYHAGTGINLRNTGLSAPLQVRANVDLDFGIFTSQCTIGLLADLVLSDCPASPVPPPAPAHPVAEVTIVTRKGSKHILSAEAVHFLNYPQNGWTGNYYPSEWPFQYWKSKTIDVINRDEEGVQLSVTIDRLSSIEVQENSWIRDRDLVLISEAGNRLNGRHVWENLNTDQKRGPSAWDNAREGVLLALTNNEYIFAPFAQIQELQFAWKAKAAK